MLTKESLPSPNLRRYRGPRALVLAAAAAGALHVLALSAGGVTTGEPTPTPAARERAMTIAAVPAPQEVRKVPAADQPARRTAAPKLPPRPAAAVAARDTQPPAAPDVPSSPEPAATSVEAPAGESNVVVAHGAVRTTAAANDDTDAEAVPVYRTALPPDTRLHYAMQRGMLAGAGDLLWQRNGAVYEVRLHAEVAGVTVLTETSTGRVDANGLAPVRYTDLRVRRGTQAANFQRDKGLISYSGPQVTHPLPAGTQDRVSWMVQIAAVLNADPRHAAPGGRVVFFVSGAHGDADVWAFRYVGAETVPGPQGAIHAVRFTREPRKAYDRQVDVWLAPAHHHLPVRARFTTTAGGETFELVLRDIGSP